jgi:hypothetical protein
MVVRAEFLGVGANVREMILVAPDRAGGSDYLLAHSTEWKITLKVRQSGECRLKAGCLDDPAVVTPVSVRGR